MQYLNTLSINTIKLEEPVGFVIYIGGSLWEDTLYAKNTLYDMGNLLSYPCRVKNVLLPQNDEDIGTRQRKLEKARNEYQLEQKKFSLTEDQQNQVNLVNVPPMVSS